MEENNNIEIIGEILKKLEFSHETHNEKFYSTVVSVKRLSGDTDELELIISEKTTNLEDIEVGKKYNIKGEIRSYNYYIKEEERRKLIITVFVKEMSIVENIENEEEECKNELVIIGHICKKPIYRKTPFGREISDLLVAVNRVYGKSDYLPCIVWGRNAKFATQLEIGDKIKITGRMQSRSYTKEIGDKKTTKVAYEISAATLEKVEEKAKEELEVENSEK